MRPEYFRPGSDRVGTAAKSIFQGKSRLATTETAMNVTVTRLPLGISVLILMLCLSFASQVAAQRENPLRRRSPDAGQFPELTDDQIQETSFLDESSDDTTVVVTEDECCDSCGDSSCDGCWHGCLAVWGSVEYLLWWQQDANLPPMVTTSVAGTDRKVAGILSEPGTEIIWGGDVATNAMSGGRLTVGVWLDSCARIGIAGRGFALQQGSAEFSADSTTVPILARPFFNAFTGFEDAFLYGYPAELTGSVDIALESEVTGIQTFLRHELRRGCNYRIDSVLGYRYLGVRESLRINSETEFIDTSDNKFGTVIEQFDLFDVDNEFNGGEIGIMGHSVDGRWTLDFHATVSLGEMRQRATVAGSGVVTPLGAPSTELVGGLLTQGTNIGIYEANHFAVIPEATFTLGYFLTPRLDLSVGYTFLYVNRLSRPGQVVDTEVNLTQQTGPLEGPARPEFVFRDSDYWLQGLNVGLNLRY